MGELGIGRDELLGVLPRFLDDRPVAGKVGDSRRGQAVLLCGEEVARAAEAKVELGQVEAVAGLGKGLQPLLRLVVRRRGEDAEVPGMAAAADSPAELVELGQAKP